MDAVISGRAGVALLLDGERLSTFNLEEPERLAPRNYFDVPYLFGESSDLKFLEDVTTEQARAALELEYKSSLALDLALILLDSDYSDPEVAAELDELLADPRVFERLENVMYAAPLPSSADLKGAKQSSQRAGADRVGEFLELLEENQPAIDRVKQAWEAVPTNIFASWKAKADFARAAMDAGFVRELVLVFGRGPFSAARVNPLWNADILLRYGEILERWSKILADLPGLPIGSVSTESTYPAPGGIERALARIWSHVLGMDEVGLDVNFFDLGGNSLSAIRARARIEQELRIDLSLVEMFQFPTIRLLARLIGERREISRANEDWDRTRISVHRRGLLVNANEGNGTD